MATLSPLFAIESGEEGAETDLHSSAYPLSLTCVKYVRMGNPPEFVTVKARMLTHNKMEIYVGDMLRSAVGVQMCRNMEVYGGAGQYAMISSDFESYDVVLVMKHDGNQPAVFQDVGREDIHGVTRLLTLLEFVLIGDESLI